MDHSNFLNDRESERLSCFGQTRLPLMWQSHKRADLHYKHLSTTESKLFKLVKEHISIVGRN